MKICIIGSSHLGALKTGWDQISAKYSDTQCVFFGAPDYGFVETLDYMTLEGHKIIPTSKGVAEYFQVTADGLQEIDIDAYDAFVIQGCGVGLFPIIREIYSNYVSDSMKVDDTKFLVSDHCYQETVACLLGYSLAVKLINTIRMVTDKPVLISPVPRPSEEVLTSNSPIVVWNDLMKIWKRVFHTGDNRFIYQHYVAALQRMSDNGYFVCDAPQETITQDILTCKPYAEDGEWLQNRVYEKTMEGDYFHMNASYGSAVLRDLFIRLSACL